MPADAKFMNEVDMVMQEIDQDVLDLMQDFLFEYHMIYPRLEAPRGEDGRNT